MILAWQILLPCLCPCSGLVVLWYLMRPAFVTIRSEPRPDLVTPWRRCLCVNGQVSKYSIVFVYLYDFRTIDIHILPRDAMLARYILWSCVCPSVYLSQVGVLSKQLNGSSWVFFCKELPSTYPTLCDELRKYLLWSSVKIGTFSSRIVSCTLDFEVAAYRSSQVLST